MALNDIPLEACVAKAGPFIAAGATVHQKFTCAKCGSRQIMDEPNKFFTSGTCEACGHTTEITKCGFLLHSDSGRKKEA